MIIAIHRHSILFYFYILNVAHVFWVTEGNEYSDPILLTHIDAGTVHTNPRALYSGAIFFCLSSVSMPHVMLTEHISMLLSSLMMVIIPLLSFTLSEIRSCEIGSIKLRTRFKRTDQGPCEFLHSIDTSTFVAASTADSESRA